MHKYTLAFLLAIMTSAAFGQSPEMIVQWKKDSVPIFVGREHQTMTMRQKNELPPQAVVIEREGPLLGFREPSTHQMMFVNKSDVATNALSKPAIAPSEGRSGSCSHNYGTGFTRSC